MIDKKKENSIIKVGVFYDGNYLSHVSNFYTYHHPRNSRISISGIHNFIRNQLANLEDFPEHLIHIVDSHYFRGRMPARKATEQNVDQLYKDRQWDDVLIREGVTMHFLPLSTSKYGEYEEKGVDVLFALECYELSIHKEFDVVVLVTGDGDFVPLVKKLNTLGTKVMLLAWDFSYEVEGQTKGTRTNQFLVNEVTYPIMMTATIDNDVGASDEYITGIFVSKKEDPDFHFIFQDESAVEEIIDELITGEILFGSIVTIHPDKRFAFIRPDLGGENVFLHKSSLILGNISDLKKDSRVSYIEKKTERGSVAYNVEIVSIEPL